MAVKIKPGSILLVASALAAMLGAPVLAGLYIPDTCIRPQSDLQINKAGLSSFEKESESAVTSKIILPESETGAQSPKSTVTIYDAEADKIMTLDFEEYLIGVVAGEMPVSFGPEALKAQAVAARSYAMYKISHGSQNSPCHKGAQLCTDSTHCKAYVTIEALSDRCGADIAEEIFFEVKSAVAATKGEILSHDGEAALAVFHSSSKGFTESAEAVWGNAVPYLVSVETPEDTDPQVMVFTRTQFAELLSVCGVSYEETEAPVLVYDAINRVKSVKFGEKAVSGVCIRQALGLRSTDFTLVILDSEYIITSRGYGHGVGMSQYGAAEMAAAGSSYKEILAHYYPGTELKVQAVDR